MPSNVNRILKMVECALYMTFVKEIIKTIIVILQYVNS